MAEARDEDAGAEADPLGPVRGATELRPHVGVERRRIVEPGTPVAEALGGDDVIRRVERRGEGAGQLERHGQPPRVRSSRYASATGWPASRARRAASSAARRSPASR